MNSPASTKCRSATEAIGRYIVPLCACIVFLLSGCDRISQISRYLYLRQCDTDIKKAARAIESAQDDAQRASGYADRGAALGEKARYSRAFKLIPGDEYARLFDLAIKDHGQEMALNPQGRFRLADAYCGRGTSYLKEKKYEFAVSDFEKSIEIGSSADGCACDPYNPLVGIYLDQTREYDKAREVVRREQTSRRWIAPEYLEKLKNTPTGK